MPGDFQAVTQALEARPSTHPFTHMTLIPGVRWPISPESHVTSPPPPAPMVAFLACFHGQKGWEGAVAVAALRPSAEPRVGTADRTASAALGVTRITSMVSCALPKIQWECAMQVCHPKVAGLIVAAAWSP